MRRLLALAAVSALALAACSSTSGGDSSSSAPASPPTVVIVSGVAAISPFTTPEAACTSGFAAGNTDTYMREQLLAAGFQVYTSPAMVGGGVVTDQTTPEGGPFGSCPPQPPADVTVNPIVSPETGGAVLADFLRWLQKEHGVNDVHLVAHSMGGIFSRIAIGDLKTAGDGPRIDSLTTVGSPWEPVMIANYEPGQEPPTACDGNEPCIGFQAALLAVPTVVKEMVPFLQKPNYPAWTQQQAGVLEGIPVTLIGGTYFTKDGGSPERWPNDAVVQIDGALARSVSDDVLPHRACHSFPDTHSIAVSAVVGAPNETALTWDPKVSEAIIAGIEAAPTAMQSENRVGCPAP
ncbi:MAG: esterase/lipase family protein [Candidatus Nanopelagicales bacterium]